MIVIIQLRQIIMLPAANLKLFLVLAYAEHIAEACSVHSQGRIKVSGWGAGSSLTIWAQASSTVRIWHCHSHMSGQDSVCTCCGP